MKTWFFVFMMTLIIGLSAQPKHENLDKLKDIKTDASKVTLTIDGEKYEFTGDEAKALLKSLKMVSKISCKHDGNLLWISEDEDVSHLNADDMKIKILQDGDEDVFMLHQPDSNATVEEIEIEEDESGTKVTVTTTVKGESSKKVLEGKEAEEYLKEMEKDKKLSIIHSDCKDLLIHDESEDAGKHKIIKKYNIITGDSTACENKNFIIIKKHKKEE